MEIVVFSYVSFGICLADAEHHFRAVEKCMCSTLTLQNADYTHLVIGLFMVHFPFFVVLLQTCFTFNSFNTSNH